jgi:RNase H-fold protein (predicted Holliday junction resolvase)
MYSSLAVLDSTKDVIIRLAEIITEENIEAVAIGLPLKYARH